MKRDLKKWLESDIIQTIVTTNTIDVCDELIESKKFNTNHELVQFIWCEAQKQFLKNLLENIDEELEKLYKRETKSAGSKAQLIAYEESLKQWLLNKYHYLKRRNS
jgi:23S rRNA maturation mini-RNase III